tara:strand:- start:60 stop:365 length:306 start_codon:yes stop_codon:yes gene_type:complete
VLATLSKINPQGKEEKAPWYSSCPKCQKKVVGDESSGFNCDSCGWSGNECKYRYILPCVANDAGGAPAPSKSKVALLVEATAGHRQLIRLPPKARGGPPHS